MQIQDLQNISLNGGRKTNKKSQPRKAGSTNHTNGNTFDPNKYMLKLPKTKKVQLSNGQVKYERTEADYLPVAARIAWFRRDHPDWSIITEAEQLANKGVVMKATIRNADKRIIATARKKETEIGFPDYIEKAETGAVGRALAMCGYGTLQAPEFDEGERIADSPIEKKDQDS
jgi:hypothetical protein